MKSDRNPTDIRPRQPFLKSLGYIVFFLFIMLFLFTLYLYRNTMKSSADRDSFTYSSIMSQTVSEIDRSLYFLSQIMESVSSNPVIVSSIINPGTSYPERNSQVINTLSYSTRDNAYIKEIYLYEHKTGTIYASDGTMTTASPEDSAAAQTQSAVTAALSATETDILTEEKFRSVSGWMINNDSLYFFKQFLYNVNASPMATLLLEIDKSVLFQSACETADAISSTLQITTPSDTTLLEHGRRKSEGSASGTILMNSDISGWTFTLRHPMITTLSTNDAMKLLGVVFAISLIGIAVSFFIARRINAPVLAAYNSALVEQRNAMEAITSIKPDVEDNLFKSILDNVYYPEEYLEHRLGTIQSSFSLHGMYRVIVFYPEPDASDEQKNQQHLQSLCEAVSRSTLSSAGNINQGSSIVFVKNNYVVLIHHFEYGMTELELLQAWTELWNRLEQTISTFPFAIHTGHGRLYHHVKDIVFSFNEAQQRLKNKVTSGNSNDEREENKDFAEQISAFQQLLASGKSEEISDLCSRIIEDVRYSENTDEYKKYIFEQLLNSIVKQLLKSHASVPEDVKDTLLEQAGDLYEMSVDDAAVFVREQSDYCLALLQRRMQGRQNALYLKARKYIDDHFQDAGLSLESVADALSISPSYLSKVFYECGSETPSSYLQARRVEAAQQLLSQTSLRIKDISLQTGFTTVQQFNRTFKKITGKTPTEFREGAGNHRTGP